MTGWMKFTYVEYWSLEVSVPYSGFLDYDISLVGRYHLPDLNKERLIIISKFEVL